MLFYYYFSPGARHYTFLHLLVLGFLFPLCLSRTRSPSHTLTSSAVSTLFLQLPAANSPHRLSISSVTFGFLICRTAVVGVRQPSILFPGYLPPSLSPAKTLLYCFRAPASFRFHLFLSPPLAEIIFILTPFLRLSL